MDPINWETAMQSLSDAGFRFSVSPLYPPTAPVEMRTQIDGRWPRGPCSSPIPDSLRCRILEQTILKQRQEMARLIMQEQILRQDVRRKEQRIDQMEKRTRHQKQTRDLLVDLHMRITEIETQLGLPQVSVSSQRRALTVRRFYGDEPPQLTAEPDS